MFYNYEVAQLFPKNGMIIRHSLGTMIICTLTERSCSSAELVNQDAGWDFSGLTGMS